MRRRLLLTAAVLALAGVGLGVWLLVPSGPGVTKANFDRIEKGLLFEDAVALLGPPTDVSSSGRPWNMLHNLMDLDVGQSSRVWAGDDGGGVIVFDEQQRAVQFLWIDAPETFLERLRRRMPWLPF